MVDEDYIELQDDDEYIELEVAKFRDKLRKKENRNPEKRLARGDSRMENGGFRINMDKVLDWIFVVVLIAIIMVFLIGMTTQFAPQCSQIINGNSTTILC